MGRNRGSIEERRVKIVDKGSSNMNNTTRNFSSIINNVNKGLNNSMVFKKTAKKETTNNNSPVANAKIKLVPINKVRILK